MRQYKTAKQAEKPNYFAQGFRLGLVSGALGALVILGRYNRPVITTTATSSSGATTTVITTTNTPPPPRVTGIESAPQPTNDGNANAAKQNRVAEG